MTEMTEVQIPNRDDLPIRGNLHRPEGEGPWPLVLVAHGFKGFKDWGFFPHLADGLAERGLAALRFNFARNGVGDDPVSFDRLDLFRENSVSRELADLEDLLAALPEVDGVADLDLERLGLFGHSRGGGVAVLFAARETRIRSLATWAAVAGFGRFFPPEVLRRWKEEGVFHVVNARTGQEMPLGMDLWRDLAERAEELDVSGAEVSLGIPHLIVHGEADEAVPASDAETLSRASGGRARVEIVAGTGHTFGAVHPFGGTTEALDRAIEFTAEHFLATL